MKKTVAYSCILAALVLGLVCGIATGRTTEPVAEKKASMGSAPAETRAGFTAERDGYKLVPAVQDAGDFLEGQSKILTVKLERPADTEIRIGRIYTSCKCLSASAKKMIVPADEEVVIDLTLHTLTMEGENEKKTFFVELLEPQKLTLQGEVTADVKRLPSLLRVHPESAHFGSLRTKKEKSFRVENLTRSPLTITKVSAEPDWIQVPQGLKRIAPGESLTLTVGIDLKTATQGRTNGAVLIETDQALHDRIRLPVTVTVYKDDAK